MKIQRRTNYQFVPDAGPTNQQLVLQVNYILPLDYWPVKHVDSPGMADYWKAATAAAGAVNRERLRDGAGRRKLYDPSPQ